MNYRSPFGEQNVENTSRHWLGTDRLGRDTLAGLISGCRYALIVGLFALLIAGVIGIFAGSVAGYFGDNEISMTRAQLIRCFLTGILSLIWSVHMLLEKSWFIGLITLFVLGAIMWFATWPLSLIKNLNRRWKLPLDQITMRVVEIVDSLPKILIILVVLATVNNRSIWHVVILLGLFNWPTIARIVRGEVLKLKSTDFITASRLLGFSNLHIIRRHILPNALPPILVILAFTASEAILYESTLSFLGIGASETEITWAQMLAMARQNYEAWWMVIFPGILLFLTIYALNHMADQYDKWIRRRELFF